MCFSPTASFTAGAALLIVGTVTARRARRPSELPFALIPVLFGIQQVMEGAIWLTLPDKAPQLNTVLTVAYSIFSHVLWPVYVPISILLFEPARWRRGALAAIALAGGAVGLYLLYFLLRFPITSEVQGHHIAYISPHFYIVAVMLLYVLSTCISMLFSSFPRIRLFGVAAFVAFVATYVFYEVWLISVWCFFAAALSFIVLLHFPPRSAGPPRTLPLGAAPLWPDCNSSRHPASLKAVRAERTFRRVDVTFFTRRLVRLTAFTLMTAVLAGCGVNSIPTRQERAKAAWADVQKDRRAEVIADSGVNGKIAPEAWEAVVAALVSGMKAGNPGDGFVAAIDQTGRLLATHFPAHGTNTNEFPDAVNEIADS